MLECHFTPVVFYVNVTQMLAQKGKRSGVWWGQGYRRGLGVVGTGI